MTEEKSYCFYDTRFARFTAGACFCIALLQFAGLAPVWLLELNCRFGIKASVCDQLITASLLAFWLRECEALCQ
jgi:hypothetical protein